LEDATRLAWQISIANHYQMSNRFASARKLTGLGKPVVLVYLGFIRANDMSKTGEMPFADAAARDAVTIYSVPTPTASSQYLNNRPAT
jgi:hypothetical protein